MKVRDFLVQSCLIQKWEFQFPTFAPLLQEREKRPFQCAFVPKQLLNMYIKSRRLVCTNAAGRFLKRCPLSPGDGGQLFHQLADYVSAHRPESHTESADPLGHRLGRDNIQNGRAVLARAQQLIRWNRDRRSGYSRTDNSSHNSWPRIRKGSYSRTNRTDNRHNRSCRSRGTRRNRESRRSILHKTERLFRHSKIRCYRFESDHHANDFCDC